MSVSIRWTPDAINSFHRNIEYLQQDWSVKIGEDFIGRVDEILTQIKVNPYLFPIHRPKDKIHRCVINTRIILYYKIVDSGTIDLLLFWNTWQNPAKLNF